MAAAKVATTTTATATETTKTRMQWKNKNYSSLSMLWQQCAVIKQKSHSHCKCNEFYQIVPFLLQQQCTIHLLRIVACLFARPTATTKKTSTSQTLLCHKFIYFSSFLQNTIHYSPASGVCTHCTKDCRFCRQPHPTTIFFFSIFFPPFALPSLESDAVVHSLSFSPLMRYIWINEFSSITFFN